MKKESKKSKMKKTSPEDNALKNEIAGELGLLDKIEEVGWAGLTAQESGRIGGIMTARKKKKKEKEESNKLKKVE